MKTRRSKDAAALIGLLLSAWCPCLGEEPRPGPAQFVVLMGSPHVDLRQLSAPRVTEAATSPSAEPDPSFRLSTAADGTPASEGPGGDMFEGARWLFLPDRSFVLVPPPAAKWALDSDHLSGHYQRKPGTIELRAQQSSVAGTSVSLDGVIHQTASGWHIDAVYTTVTVTGTWAAAIIDQDLTEVPSSLGPEAPRGGVQALASFDVTLTGEMDGRNLPVHTAILRVLPIDSGASVPCAIVLETTDAPGPGSLSWVSPSAGASTHAISVAAGATIVSDIGETGSAASSPSWDNSVPSWWALTDSGSQTSDSPPSSSYLDNPRRFFAQHSRLTIRISGDELSGEITATGDGRYQQQDELMGGGQMPLPFGEAAKAKARALAAAARLRRSYTATLQGRRRDDAAISLETSRAWSAVSTLPLRESRYSGIRGGKIGGAIDVGDTAHASVGEIDREVARARQALGELGLAGRWYLREAGGEEGALELKRDGSALRGSLRLAHSAVEMVGTERDNGAELSADGDARGSLVLRMLLPGELLVGYFEPSGGERQIVAFVGRRRLASPVASEAAGADDALKLALLGRDLAGRGRCEAGRRLLQEAQAIYGRQVAAETAPVSDFVIRPLADCDFALGDYDGYVKDLRLWAVTVRRKHSAEVAMSARSASSNLPFIANTDKLMLQGLHAALERLSSVDTAPEQGSTAAALLACRAAASELAANIANDDAQLQQAADRMAADWVAHKPRHTDQDIRADLAFYHQWRQYLTSAQRKAKESFECFATLGSKELASDAHLRGTWDRFWGISRKLEPWENAAKKSHHQAPAAMEAALAAIRDTEELEPAEILSEIGASQSPCRGQLAGVIAAGRAIRHVQAGLYRDRSTIENHFVGPYAAHLNDALLAANELLTRAERLRGMAADDAAKIGLVDELQGVYAELVLAVLDAEQPDEALVLSESARGRALADLLNGHKYGADEKRCTEGGLRSDGSPAPPLTRWGLQDIARTRGTTTLEYMITEETLIIWVVSPDGGIEAVPVSLRDVFPPSTADASRSAESEAQGSPRALLRRSVDELHLLLEGDRTTTATFIADRDRTHQLLRQLYALLIEPVVSHLPRTPDEVVTIIPHEELFRVPFAALELPLPAGSSPRDDIPESHKYLIENHALVYGTSLEVLKYAGAVRDAIHASPQRRLLALVDPSPMPVDEKGVALPQIDVHLRETFDKIAALFPASPFVLTGKQARKAELHSEEAREASEIYLVTHAKFLPQRPMDSFIAFAGDPGSKDGYLRVPEAFCLDLKAELVLLWACETGVGEITGEGVVGFNRAFTLGSANLMLSLWPVQEEPSAEQMMSFHVHWLKEGLALAQALRRAQVDQLQAGEVNRLEPARWAAFSLYGEGR